MTLESIVPSTLPAPCPRRRTIAFTSGKGGVGKSNLVLNTGVLLARGGARVALLDGDLGLANLNVLVGQTPKFDLRHVMAGDKRLIDIIVPGPEGILLIPAGPGVAELANLDGEQREILLGQLAEVEQTVDFLLIDTGAGLGDTVLNLVAAADEAVVVTRPEPTALADAYALMKVIIQCNPAYPFHLLVNMVRNRDQGHQIYVSLSQILLRFLGYQPGYAGFVLTDPCVSRAVVQQVPFALLSPQSEATRCLEALSRQLLGRAASASQGEGFWRRVAGWGLRRS
jgi:flagellar biosynthesis protein FlhG